LKRNANCPDVESEGWSRRTCAASGQHDPAHRRGRGQFRRASFRRSARSAPYANSQTGTSLAAPLQRRTVPPMRAASLRLYGARAAKRSPCRRAPSSHLREWRLPGRPTFPSRGCLHRGHSFAAFRAAAASWQKQGRCSAGPARGCGIAIKPRRRKRGNAGNRPGQRLNFVHRYTTLVSLAADVDLQEDVYGGRSGGRCSARRWAIRARSTGLHPGRNASARGRLLLLWIGPMKCHSRATPGAASRTGPRSCRTPLPDVVFAKRAQPGPVRGEHL